MPDPDVGRPATDRSGRKGTVIACMKNLAGEELRLIQFPGVKQPMWMPRKNLETVGPPDDPSRAPRDPKAGNPGGHEPTPEEDPDLWAEPE